MAAVTICSDLPPPPTPPRIKSVTVSTVSPSICQEVMESDAMIFVFWMLSFKPAFPLSFFMFTKRLFSSSPFSATRVVSPAYLRLLLFLLAMLISAFRSSSQAFTQCTLIFNKGDKMQPWYTPFAILNQSFVPCSVLTVASWHTYRFLRRQVKWSGIPSL